MNLPTAIVNPQGTHSIVYGAGGSKLTQTPAGGAPRRDYFGEIEYSNQQATAIYHEEGRALKVGSTWVYEYVLRDHLGNTRVTFRTSTTGAVTVQSVLDYYPFGMVNADRSSGAGGYPYKYNGKEFAEELGLSDYGARWYDPAVGRWLAVDPLALEYANFSPYNYVANNPINAIDPNGEYIIVLAGSAQDREFFINQINTLFGGNVNASFSSGGGSRLILEQTGALNEEQQVAFDIISGYANNEDEITVRLANNDKSINFESYDSREFDPSDFSAYSDNMKGSRSALSHYVHFFAEQYDRQVVQGLLGVIRQGQGEDPGKPSQEFLKSHEFALEQEALVSGVFTRDTDMKSYSGGIDLITFTNFDKNGKPVSTYQVWSGGEKGPKVSKPIPVNK